MPFFPALVPLEDDPIMIIPQEFKADARDEKANLGVGAYRDERGLAWILPSIKEAEKALLTEEINKDYLPIQGDPEFCALIPKHIFGESHPLIKEKRLATLQTLGGSGALRVIGDFLKKHRPESSVYLSNPTWPNHTGIFEASDLTLCSYPYYDKESQQYLHKELTNALKEAPEDSVFVFHGCCHNPTGIDPSEKQWKEIFDLCKKHSHFVIIDVAYQGFGISMEHDALPLRLAAETLPQFAVCYSCSKNMGLYGERIGHLTVAFEDQESASNALTHLKKVVRGSYSSPPLRGARLAAKILSDSELKDKWLKEVEHMRLRVIDMRKKLSAALDQMKTTSLSTGNGMFSLLPLKPEEVSRLKKECGIYMPNSGRINVAGLTDHNLPLVANALNSI